MFLLLTFIANFEQVIVCWDLGWDELIYDYFCLFDLSYTHQQKINEHCSNDYNNNNNDKTIKKIITLTKVETKTFTTISRASWQTNKNSKSTKETLK